MKVCFVAGTLGRGGAERQLLLMLKALRHDNASVRVLSLTKGEDYERELENIGVRVEFVGSSSNHFRRLWSIIDNLRKNSVDILQSSHFFANTYAALAGRALGIPAIGAIRGNLAEAMIANGRFGGAHLKLPHHLIANSQSAATEAIEKGIDETKIDFVRNAVEFDGLERSEPIRDRQCLNVLFAGRLVPLKRPDLFLRLASQLQSELPDQTLRFKIAGDGPMRGEVERLAYDKGLLPNHLELLGEVREIDRVYRRADILVSTSLHEGTPNVILEAMSHGIPVVATRVGGVPEVLTERAGFTVEPNDFENLVDCTKTLIKNADLRLAMGAHGFECVRKNHSMGYLREKLTKVYSKVLNCNGTNGKSGPNNQ